MIVKNRKYNIGKLFYMASLFRCILVIIMQIPIIKRCFEWKIKQNEKAYAGTDVEIGFCQKLGLGLWSLKALSTIF